MRLGGNGGPLLVSGGTTQAFAMTTAANGTIGFTLGGGLVTLSAGSLTGRAQALQTSASTRQSLDTLADNLSTAVNAVQTAGVALDGSAGQPLFSGAGAAGITLALTTGAQLASAPAGAGPGSRDPANLDALRTALATADIAGGVNGLLFTVSSTVAGRRTTLEAIDTIAASARISLDTQSGVDLDAEAANLVRFQQAFQANGKAMQVAATLFDTLLGIGR